MRMSLMKPSPKGFIACAKVGNTKPDQHAGDDAHEHARIQRFVERLAVCGAFRWHVLLPSSRSSRAESGAACELSGFGGNFDFFAFLDEERHLDFESRFERGLSCCRCRSRCRRARPAQWR